MFICRTFLLFFLLQLFSASSYSLAIKQSSSGLCHPPESSYYQRTKHYTAFDTLQTCLDAGGHLPKGISASSNSGLASREYERSAFGHGWDDVDGDCQDSRAEALIATSTTPVHFADEKRCRVVAGRWVSSFTGEVIQNASNIDIDHLVPLAWAWQRGADEWTQSQRETFANDGINLWPVEASLNRSKGAQGPDQWLPPIGQCGYVARFARIVKLYGLEPRSLESEWIRSFLNGCKS